MSSLIVVGILYLGRMACIVHTTIWPRFQTDHHEINTVMGEESLHHTGRYYDAAEPLYSGALWDPPGCPV